MNKQIIDWEQKLIELNYIFQGLKARQDNGLISQKYDLTSLYGEAHELVQERHWSQCAAEREYFKALHVIDNTYDIETGE